MPGTYIKKNGSTYRFSTIHQTSGAAKYEAEGWRNAGHRAIVVKDGSRYSVYYVVKKSQYLIERGHNKAAGRNLGFNEGRLGFGLKKRKPRKQTKEKSVFDLRVY